MFANSFQGPAAAGPTGFDRVAWCYDAWAGLVFGAAQRRAQEAALEGLPTAAMQILILGGGTGWVLTEVLRRCPQARVLYLEASRNMLARARQRLVRNLPLAQHQVEFRHGTQADLAASESFDAVITFFVLDCIPLPELDAALEQLRRVQRPGAPWLLADFRPARRGWRWVLLRLMYAFFRLTTNLRARELANLRQRLQQQGLRLITRHVFFGGALEGAVFQEKGLSVYS